MIPYNRMDIINKQKPVYIVKTYDNKQIKFFITQCKKIYRHHQQFKDSFCGIDFEFNINRQHKRHDMALMQIIFIFSGNKYMSRKYIKPIFIVDLLNFDKRYKKMFIKYILCSSITKIFHGSDSLDMQALYEDIFDKNDVLFIKMINNVTDTRFLCEISKKIMYNLDLNINYPKKCSIYYAILDHDIISEDKFKELLDYSSKINYNKKWNINRLKQHQIKYSVYDVVYLYDLMSEIVDRIRCDNKSIDLISLTNRIFRFYVMNKLKILTVTDMCRENNMYYKSDMLINRHIKMDEQNILDHILDIPICDVIYRDNPLTIYIRDVLSIDTLRNSILFCIITLIYHHIDTRKKNVNKMNYIFYKSKYFKLMKGHNTLIYLFKLISDHLVID